MLENHMEKQWESESGHFHLGNLGVLAHLPSRYHLCLSRQLLGLILHIKHLR